jgi:hypothetical protein
VLLEARALSAPRYEDIGVDGEVGVPDETAEALDLPFAEQTIADQPRSQLFDVRLPEQRAGRPARPDLDVTVDLISFCATS